MMRFAMRSGMSIQMMLCGSNGCRKAAAIRRKCAAGLWQIRKMNAISGAACQLVIDNSSDIVQNTYEQMDKGLREHGFL